MHVPRPHFQLRHFVFVLQYNFKKAFNSNMNDINRGLQGISLALVCILERLHGGISLQVLVCILERLRGGAK